MEARFSTPEYSRRLPPPEAWKRPDKWIDLSTGLARSDGSKLVLPTDDRGFVNIDESIEYVLDYYFWPDFTWEYSRDDQETALDRHHFQHRAAAYAPEAHGGNRIPYRFRENPTRIGLMPRQLHNVLHDFTAEPELPDIDAMKEFLDRYMLAHRAFSKLIHSAKNVTQASRSFSLRAEAIRNGLIIPSEANDQIAQEILRDFFSRHFEQYGQAIEEVLRLEGSEFMVNEIDKTVLERPQLVMKKIGQLVTRGHINIVPYLNLA